MEEDELTIYEGRFMAGSFGASAQPATEPLLASRHDATRRPGWPDGDLRRLKDRPDRNVRGNVALADGHVDYVNRAFTWEPSHVFPSAQFP